MAKSPQKRKVKSGMTEMGSGGGQAKTKKLNRPIGGLSKEQMQGQAEVDSSTPKAKKKPTAKKGGAY